MLNLFFEPYTTQRNSNNFFSFRGKSFRTASHSLEQQYDQSNNNTNHDANNPHQNDTHRHTKPRPPLQRGTTNRQRQPIRPRRRQRHTKILFRHEPGNTNPTTRHHRRHHTTKVIPNTKTLRPRQQDQTNLPMFRSNNKHPHPTKKSCDPTKNKNTRQLRHRRPRPRPRQLHHPL